MSEYCKTKDCNRFLYYEEEQDSGYCDNCLDKLAERYQERREWDYYHSE